MVRREEQAGTVAGNPLFLFLHHSYYNTHKQAAPHGPITIPNYQKPQTVHGYWLSNSYAIISVSDIDKQL